jgi:predicted nuclease with TOPRIM domain
MFLTMSLWLHAGVRKDIQRSYIQSYQNKAMFLKVPVRGTRQVIHVRVSGSRLDPASFTDPLRFKVGDQVRITEVDFRGDAVRFKVSSLDLNGKSELEFRFREELQDHFPQRGAFDITLKATLTEGLSYTDIESARHEFIEGEFDQFVEQLARSNNTSSDFVVTVLRDRIPDYQALRLEMNETKSMLQKSEEDLQQEKRSRLQVESEVTRLKGQLGQGRSELDRLEDERKTLMAETDRLSKDYENQVKRLIETLNVKTSSASSMEAQVEVLNDSLGTLRNERLTRAREIQGLNEQLSGLGEMNRALSEDLERVQGEKAKLWDDFSVLTSNRQGLEGRYAELLQENEQLQNASLLDDSFSLKRRIERREENEFQIADLYLLTQRIGTLEIQIPPVAGTVHPVRFTATSPDTVKFSSDERKILEILGEPFQVETAWETSSNNLNFVLLDKESRQSVGPRETIEWPWMFQGEVTQPESASLVVHLISSDGSKIFLGSQDLTISPAQMMARLRYSISPISLLAGAVLGLVVFGILFGFRKRSQPPSKATVQGAPVVHKKL